MLTVYSDEHFLRSPRTELHGCAHGDLEDAFPYFALGVPTVFVLEGFG